MPNKNLQGEPTATTKIFTKKWGAIRPSSQPLRHARAARSTLYLGRSNRGFLTTSKGWAAFFDRGAMPNKKPPGGLPDATKIFAKKWCDPPPLSPPPSRALALYP